MNEARHFTTRIAVMVVAGTIATTFAFAGDRQPIPTAVGERSRPATFDGRTNGMVWLVSDDDHGSRGHGNDKRAGSSRNHSNRAQPKAAGRSHADRRAPRYVTGRIERVRHWNDGYRVWIVGAPYPFYVPIAYWDAGRFSVGLTIRVGGYYNPGGYYEYNGDYYDRSPSAKRYRGTVLRAEHGGDRIVMRLAGTGRIMTISSRDRWERVRRGDRIVVYGGYEPHWGLFVARDVDVIDR